MTAKITGSAGVKPILESTQSKENAGISQDVICAVQVNYFSVPLSEPLHDARHGEHTHFELITCEIQCESGLKGTGYTYTGGRGGRAIVSLLEDELAPLMIGKDSQAIASLWALMQTHLHYVGRGGLLSFAISAIDIALWDVHCKRLSLPLWRALGGSSPLVDAYAGGIDLNFSQSKLLRNIQGYLDKGFSAVKIKVGKENYREDLDRLSTVRERIGRDRILMMDANFSLTIEQSIRLARAAASCDIYWFEEPTIPDDYDGYARIAEAIDIPLAMGENLHTIYEFREALTRSKLGFIQADASNIGGITGWLNVANQALSHNLPIATHGMQELHVSLLASQSHASYLEVHAFPIDQYTEQPLCLENGKARAPEANGTGVSFNYNKLEAYRP